MKIGITGGIGSGKSTVCRIFEVLGIPVYYADDRAKWLMSNDEKLVGSIIDLFGENAYSQPGNILNRAFIADIVFNDKEKLSALNALVHPAVWQDGESWNEVHKNAPYTLKEAALLFESGGHHLMDKMITVFTPKETRIERVMKRDECTKEEVLARMGKQMPDEEKKEMADFVIYNDGEHSLIQQVLTLHQAFVKQAFTKDTNKG